MQKSAEADAHTVTVYISVKARQGHERVLEKWLEGVERAASQFAGHQGLTVLQPLSGVSADYVYIFVLIRIHTSSSGKILRSTVYGSSD
jgi:antibiotic biosynthesis monooxygenase (ABM) superfamily enzyme